MVKSPTGSTGGSTSGKTSGAASRPAAKGTRRRTSKPLIIDVEAAKAATSGLDEATAKSAGLAADPVKAPKAAKPSAKPETADPVVPPAGAQNTASKSAGPGGFYIFAAGFVGALLTLVLMFLASLLGLFDLSNDGAEPSLASLSALEQRLATLEADASVPAAPDGDLLAPLVGLEGEVAALRAAVVALQAAPPAGDNDGTVAPDTAASERLDALDVGLAALGRGLEAVEAKLAASPNGLTELEQQTATMLNVLGSDVASLARAVQGLEERLAGAEQAARAAPAAPPVQAPDRLARMGVALDALLAARDGGADVADALAAARAAAQFDSSLADAFAPLSQSQIAGALDDASLLALYSEAAPAMRAALPAASEGEPESGLLGALGDRARQLVTIRAPEGTALAAGEAANAALADLEQLGALIGAGDVAAALDLSNDLPAPMQQASGSLVDRLHARVTLDEAMQAARAALLAQISDAATQTEITQ